MEGYILMETLLLWFFPSLVCNLMYFFLVKEDLKKKSLACVFSFTYSKLKCTLIELKRIDFKRKKNTKTLENSTVLYYHSLHDNIVPEKVYGNDRMTQTCVTDIGIHPAQKV